MLSRAIVPVQELDPNGAVVKIQVVEGYIETVEWPRDLLARYRDFFTYYGAQITAERPVNIRTIERYLLLAGDLPGLKFKNRSSRIRPRSAPPSWWSRLPRSRSTCSDASTIAAPRRADRWNS